MDCLTKDPSSIQTLRIFHKFSYRASLKNSDSQREDPRPDLVLEERILHEFRYSDGGFLTNFNTL